MIHRLYKISRKTLQYTVNMRQSPLMATLITMMIMMTKMMMTTIMMMMSMWATIPALAIIGSQGSDPLHYIEHHPLC